MTPDHPTTCPAPATRPRLGRWMFFALVLVLAACLSGLAAGDPPRGQVIIPVEFLRDRSPLAMQGAIVLQYRECFACHALTGPRGTTAAFDDIARRLPRAQIARDIAESPSHRSFAVALKPAEVAAATAFIAELVAPQGPRPTLKPAPPPATSR